MHSPITLIYWQGEKYYLGNILEHPEIMTQGETLEELIENIKDAYRQIISSKQKIFWEAWDEHCG